ncbi:hypothetical protein COCNU_14G000340 [Cocos nucifera]|uniref:Uncharacterized protein n=1 Tax=Cocos nucifera TaxID=13894 RepID=A0A8K0IU19_COCNU|nr:hypothetical protein COCNU_14G000340 [Cocos nucifera]
MSLLPFRSFGAAAIAVEELEYGSEWEEEHGRGRWTAAEVAKDEWGKMEGSACLFKTEIATRSCLSLPSPLISASKPPNYSASKRKKSTA